MINAKEQRIIIEVLGKHYSTMIALHLQSKGFVNAKNEMYSNSSIRQFVNGIVENIAIEMEILKFINDTKSNKKLLAVERKKLISKK